MLVNLLIAILTALSVFSLLAMKEINTATPVTIYNQYILLHRQNNQANSLLIHRFSDPELRVGGDHLSQGFQLLSNIFNYRLIGYKLL